MMKSDLKFFTKAHIPSLMTALLFIKQKIFQKPLKTICLNGEQAKTITKDILHVSKGNSVSIPNTTNLKLSFCRNDNGHCQSFYSSVPVLPITAESITIEKFFPSDFYIIVTADPQYPWSCYDSYTEDCNDQSQAKMDLDIMVSSMNRLKHRLGSNKVLGVIINGDLTAYGHGWQLSQYKKFFDEDLEINNYSGLGNHHIQNNVNDCFENNCSTNMVNYLKDKMDQLAISSFDYDESKTYYHFPSFRKTHTGSYAYSWEIGNVHFIQLNNYPGYSTKWNGWNFAKARRDYYTITSSYHWLENDLQKATANGDRIIINCHQPLFYESTFKSTIKKYPI